MIEMVEGIWTTLKDYWASINEYGEIFLVLSFVLFIVFYCLVKKIHSKRDYKEYREYRVCAAFLCFFLFIFGNLIVFGVESKVFIALIGGIIAYWRYELSKYNEIARKALSDFTEIFQKDELTKKDIVKLKCLFITLATFNTTDAWIKTKWMIERLVGLSPELGFRAKTPKFYDELTVISEGINKDNGVAGIVCFLPFIRCLVEDHHYKEWLDNAIKKLIEYYATGEYFEKTSSSEGNIYFEKLYINLYRQD